MTIEKKNSWEDTMETDADVALFESIAFFEHLRPSAKSLLKNEGRTQNLTKGSIVFMHEDDATSFYFIKSGWVKLSVKLWMAMRPFSMLCPQVLFSARRHALKTALTQAGRKLLRIASLSHIL